MGSGGVIQADYLTKVGMQKKVMVISSTAFKIIDPHDRIRHDFS